MEGKMSQQVNDHDPSCFSTLIREVGKNFRSSSMMLGKSAEEDEFVIPPHGMTTTWVILGMGRRGSS